MLTLFKRHTKACGQTSRRYRRCGCPMAVEGSLGGEKIRKTLDQTSWEAAENLVRERTLRGLLKMAKVEKGQNVLLAHRFRDTLAVSLLANGVPIEDVAAILGHSVKVCEKHYSAWVKARQVRLTERVRATWPKQERKLKAVS